jgi:predicted transcriptional regulator
MPEACCDILISLAPRHADNVLSGRKTVELRRRPLHIQPGTRVWIYTKSPRARIDALAVAATIVHGSPEELWANFGSQLALTRSHYEEYMSGCVTGCAIVLTSVSRLQKAIALDNVRAFIAGFHPPQFFKKLPLGSEELNILQFLGGSPSP